MVGSVPESVAVCPPVHSWEGRPCDTGKRSGLGQMRMGDRQFTPLANRMVTDGESPARTAQCIPEGPHLGESLFVMVLVCEGLLLGRSQSARPSSAFRAGAGKMVKILPFMHTYKHVIHMLPSFLLSAAGHRTRTSGPVEMCGNGKCRRGPPRALGAAACPACTRASPSGLQSL